MTMIFAEDIVQNVFVKMWDKRKKIIQTYPSRGLFVISPVLLSFIDQTEKIKPVIYLEKKYFEAIDLVVDIGTGRTGGINLNWMNCRNRKFLTSKCRNIFMQKGRPYPTENL